MIVAVRFQLAYTVYSWIRFSDAHRVGHLDLARRIFGYLKKYLKRGYAIKPQTLTIDANYEKVQMKYDFGNHYA